MTSSSIPSEGFVYVATGDTYYEEASRAVVSLRRHNPGRRVCLLTDRVRGEPFWDDLVVLTEPAFGFRDKMTINACPYDRFVFLDTDTTVFGPLDELFILLRRFDVCGVQLFEGHDYTLEDIPPSFGEMNSGVLGFRRCPAVDALFATWRKHYDAFRAQNQGEHYHYANVGDQKSLRVALWETDVRIAQIGPEFNFIPFKMDFASLPVRVMHTRETGGLEKLVARLNDRFGRRAYIPLFDAIVSDHPSPVELRHLTLACFRQCLRDLARLCFPQRLRDSLRRFRWVRTRFLGGHHATDDHRTDGKWERPRS